MYSEEIKEIAEKIKILENQKRKIEREIKVSSLDKELIAIAEILHKKLCNSNHTDGCGWYYGKWSDINLRYSRKKYYQKAKELRDYIEYNDINNAKEFIKGFIDIIK